jgi:hypothetical protein
VSGEPLGYLESMTIRRRTRITTAVLAAALALGPAGCDEDDAERNVEEGASEAREAGRDAKQAGEDAAREAEETGKDAAREAEQGANEVQREIEE